MNQPPALPRVVREADALRAEVAAARTDGRSVGVVPTMGALHEGHLSLVRAARARCPLTIVTIFVNPTQFGPHEDLQHYPRDLDADLGQLSAVGANLVFAPEVDDIYPAGFSTYVDPPQVALRLEGEHRPGHFRGVATVVLKLLNLVGADLAFFGRKDYQQSLVVRHLVRDLGVPVQIEVCPTVREADGLAMSSRNAYLSPQERQRALALNASLQLAEQMIDQGERDTARIVERMRQRLLGSPGVDRLDYATVADPDTLQQHEQVRLPAVALVAAHVGKTRLIDNRLIGSS